VRTRLHDQVLRLVGVETGELGQFVAGTSSGASLLHAIYDEVLSEPVPARLSTIMKDEPED